MSLSKKSWQEWSKLLVQKTQKCCGNIPSFGLPTDTYTLDEFKQSITGLSTHPAKSCSCWSEPSSNKEDLNELVKSVKEFQYRKDQESLQSQDAKETILSLAEKNVRERLVMIKDKLHLLIDKIAVDNFRYENEKLVWDLKVPKSLFSLSDVLMEFDPHKDKQFMLKNNNVELYEPYVPVE